MACPVVVLATLDFLVDLAAILRIHMLLSSSQGHRPLYSESNNKCLVNQNQKAELSKHCNWAIMLSKRTNETTYATTCTITVYDYTFFDM